MKTGRTIAELAKEIERRKSAKKDFVAPASKMLVGCSGKGEVELLLKGTKNQFPLNDVAHEQMADYLGIPMQYYRRMLKEAPQLVAANAQRWLADKARTDDRRMVRTLDGQVRAILSDKYRPLENEDLAEAVLPVLAKNKMRIISADITDQRLYIKAIDESVERKLGIRMGEGHQRFDAIIPAINISNSEVGRGSLLIEAGTYTRGCTNLAFVGAQMRKFHVGARADLSDDVIAMLSDSTKRVSDAALWMQVQDLVKGAFDPAKFDILVASLDEAAKDRIDKKADVVEVVSLAGRKLGFSEDEGKGVLQHLIEGGDLTRYGLHAAVTRFAQDCDSYDRASELEKMGGRVIQLPKSDWMAIAKAA